MLDQLYHYGTPRHSGRYPWGSGEHPYQRNAEFLKRAHSLEKQGLSEREIAAEMGCRSTSELRAKKSIYRNENRKADVMEARRLYSEGKGASEIGRIMGKSESTIRSLLDEERAERSDAAQVAADKLKKLVDEKGFIDVGAGTELYLGVSELKEDTALAILKEQGYVVHPLQVEQLGTGNRTTLKILCPPGTEWAEVANNKDKINSVTDFTIDPEGNRRLGTNPPKSISSDRVMINYSETGGAEKDGVIELRRGVDDLSLGNAKYAQVRIAVDDTHYLKGMAMYSDNMPEGVDVIFNTNKHEGTPMMGDKDNSVLKPLKDDKDNVFGATIKDQNSLKLVQTEYIDKDGNVQQSAINVVNEEGDWDKWSRNLSSQFLSKQNTTLAKKQLDLAYAEKNDEYNEIISLTNPTVKKQLLESFAEDCDSAAVHLKAAALPRQSNKVILPVTTLNDNEVYAPTYRDGESVVLVRHPHGGTFEIPQLIVNNQNKTAKETIGNSTDAIGINSKVAARLSGADFDGDTVLVIPTSNVKIKTSSPLKDLQDFNPSEAYPGYSGMPKIKPQTKQTEMGKVSNLITDMTLKGATDEEKARAVKHSMVVIDSEKHNLDYKRSFVENGIAELKKKYQGGEKKGASTLISRASSEVRIEERKRSYKPNPDTGEWEYTNTGRTYKDKNGKTKLATEKVTRMEIAKDAMELSSGTPMENIYASFANKMKALANKSRKAAMSTPKLEYNPSARKTYEAEVKSLDTSLTNALMNAPKERMAQVKANYSFSVKKKQYPDMDNDHVKKLKNQELASARTQFGAKKPSIKISDREWDAIQAGAISDSKLKKILDNTDIDEVKKMAMPRTKKGISSSKVARIKAMSASGFSISEIADSLGISTSTVSETING